MSSNLHRQELQDIWEEEPSILEEEPFNAEVWDQEQKSINRALDRLVIRVKRTLREWPFCNKHNRVFIPGPAFSRDQKRVYLYWYCEDCEQERLDDPTR